LKEKEKDFQRILNEKIQELMDEIKNERKVRRQTETKNFVSFNFLLNISLYFQKSM